MILLSLLEGIVDAYKRKNVTPVMSSLEDIAAAVNEIDVPQEVSDYQEYIRILSGVRDETKKLEITLDAGDLKNILEAAYVKAIDKWEAEDNAINEKYENMLNNKVTELEVEAKEYNKIKKLELDENNQKYLILEKKRKKLENYSDKIIDVCSRYGVTTSDIDIDNSSFTVSELSEIYDKYIAYMEKKEHKKNIIKLFRSTVPNPFIQIGVVFLILVVMISPLAVLFAVTTYAYLLINKIGAVNKIKSCIVLYGLVFNIHPMDMGFKGEVDESELQNEDVNEDEDARLNSISEEWAAALDEHDKINPESDLEADRLKLAANLNQIMAEFKNLIEKFNEEKEDLLDELEYKIQSAEIEFDEKKKTVKLLGMEVTKNPIFDTNFRLGIHDGVVEEVYDIGLNNILIRPPKDELMHRMFLQVMLANAICNVRASNIAVHICDPNQRGQDLINFYDQSIEDLIIFEKDTLEAVLKNLGEFADRNNKELRGMDIQEFNKKAVEVGKTTREYRLLIVLSQPKKIEEDEALAEFMKYSARLGVFIWVVTDKDIPGTKVFEKPFDGVENPYRVDVNIFGSMVAKTLQQAVKDGSSDALTWKKFISVAAKDDEIWSRKGDSEIEIMPGFYEGDPTQYKGYTFGNEGNIHMIGVGGTGAGKSVFLNFVICCLTRLYSPRDLELWLIDFKGNEFSKYLPAEGRPEMLPHVKACLCTSDGDYAGSVFSALRKITEERYEYLKKLGLKNMLQYNKKMRAEGRLDELMPRILCVNDEFQVIFEKAEPKILDQINEDIVYLSKVGRAAGAHLFFTSQSMKGTIKEDTLNQFSLRFALRCAEDVSMSVLGSKLASEIKQKNGYLYVRSYDSKSLDALKRYRTPYLCDEPPTEKEPNKVDELAAHIVQMAHLAEEWKLPKKDVITYEESVKHYVTDIDAFFEKNASSIVQGFFLLGERMTYSSNRAPENVILTAENNQHIFAAFTDIADLVNFYKAMKRCIDLQPGEKEVMYNSQVKDLHYLCELDKDVPEVQATLSTEKTDISILIISVYKAIYDGRVQNNKKDVPLYIFLIGWDKALGFGIDKDTSLVGDFATLLQICGEYNMHFIFICSGVGQIGANIINACRYRICGKVDESASYKILDTKQGCKNFESMKNGYLFINRGGIITRAKIYQSKLEREIKATELVL